MSDWPDLHVGDHVEDADDEVSTTMLVVDVEPRRIDETPVGDGRTVADANPGYDADEQNIGVVFAGRTDVTVESLQQYGFPRSRLRRVQALHDDEAESEGMVADV